MRRLARSELAASKGSAGESDRDHVLAADNVAFVVQRSRTLVDVEGWNQPAVDAQGTFLDELSDRATEPGRRAGSC